MHNVVMISDISMINIDFQNNADYDINNLIKKIIKNVRSTKIKRRNCRDNIIELKMIRIKNAFD